MTRGGRARHPAHGPEPGRARGKAGAVAERLDGMDPTEHGPPDDPFPPGRRPDRTAEPDAQAEFTAWYARDFARVRATVALAVGDAGLAEEATAEAFARALARWPAVSRMASPYAWVQAVALNEVRSRFRRLRLERRYLARQRAGHTPPPPEPDPALWAAVARLAPRARTAVALRYIADLSEQEVADAMGITRGTAAATLHKARKRLGELLAADVDARAAALPRSPR
jgi:RNA polymerase sigma-70 factor (ECF subfamily)